jgi:hypothetical protein
MRKLILSPLVAAVAALVVAAAPAAAAPTGQYESHLEQWVGSHHPSQPGFRASDPSAYCSSFEHRVNQNKRWRFCKVYQPYTSTHGSDDWHDWTEQVCWSHWKVFWRFHKSWQFSRQDAWHCQDLSQNNN